MNKFKEIFLDLEQKILTKVYPPHTLLPSEKQLIDIYGASRETIRKYQFITQCWLHPEKTRKRINCLRL